MKLLHGFKMAVKKPILLCEKHHVTKIKKKTLSQGNFSIKLNLNEKIVNTYIAGIRF